MDSYGLNSHTMAPPRATNVLSYQLLPGGVYVSSRLSNYSLGADRETLERSF
jgi:hypothetical protein